MTAAQFHLFDPVKGEAGKRQGMALVQSHTPEDFIAEALRAVRVLCETRSEFTTDAVWALLERWGVSFASCNPKTMGNVMLTAARRNWCRKTDRVVKSTISSNHRRPVTVWLSLLYGRTHA